MPLRCIIAGSRSITDARVVNDAIRRSPFFAEITEVVSGGARGADQLGEGWAESVGLPVRRFVPDWNRYGKSAGFRRNEEMAAYAHALVAVWDGRSRGTAHMVEEARRRGLRVFVERIDP